MFILAPYNVRIMSTHFNDEFNNSMLDRTEYSSVNTNFFEFWFMQSWYLFTYAAENCVCLAMYQLQVIHMLDSWNCRYNLVQESKQNTAMIGIIKMLLTKNSQSLPNHYQQFVICCEVHITYQNEISVHRRENNAVTLNNWNFKISDWNLMFYEIPRLTVFVRSVGAPFGLSMSPWLLLEVSGWGTWIPTTR